MGWVLSVIDQIKFLTSPPSVAVLPLGTGNDLARALNWGGAYTNESLSKLLAKTLESRNVKLDRWKILTQVNQNVDLKQQQQNNKENSSTENAIEKLKNDVMNNYFSIGADAHVCLEFHERRGKTAFLLLPDLNQREENLSKCYLFFSCEQQKPIRTSLPAVGSICCNMWKQAARTLSKRRGKTSKTTFNSK